MTIINTSISNAENIEYQKSSKTFFGMIKGSNSGKLFDVTVAPVNGTMVAAFDEVGAKGKGISHKLPLTQVKDGGLCSEITGKKRPHYSGRIGNVSVAIWRNDYTPTQIFVIFTDEDLEAVAAADAMWNSVQDDEAADEAATFFEQADGDAGRPDTSDAGEAEALKHSLALNG